MSSKNEILARIRRQSLPDSPLPSLQGDWIRFADRESQFISVVQAVGGQARVVNGDAELADAVRALPVLVDAKQIVCAVPGLDLGTYDEQTVDDPHSLADVDVAIVPGEFAVAENGAVWMAGRGIRHRAIYFLTQHLVIVTPRAKLLDHMHEAYERLKFEQPSYGVFISGPSKTADIEQSLVIGAHGPRSLNVYLLG
jgi:L-lactate dehydrogenase complex protein LldG